ncbi:MAG: glycosyltransferase [Clostridia bacterium]|nr:glycosyltransferase [Clostridia bacterium]
MVRASVAMAVYNGEKYIRQQIDSILPQLTAADELVISYDRSSDSTWDILLDYAQRDARIRVIKNSLPQGVQNNFTCAVLACGGEYIFLADQDDLWYEGKLEKVISAFEETGAHLVVHDGHMTDENLNILEGTIFQRFGTYDNPLLNIVKQNYWGCCMAFRSDIRKRVCPFPATGGVGHDIWIGIVVGFWGKIHRIDQCLIAHRLHESNYSSRKHRKLWVIARHRAFLLGHLVRKGWRYLWKKD